MSFLGCSNADLSADDHLPGKANYYTGTRKDWRTNVSQYSSVRYAHIYPAIDLKFHGALSSLEYDFILKPRADYKKIQLRFDDADKVTIDSRGELLVTRATNVLRFKKPSIYQESSGRQIAVKGGFKLSGTSVGFWVGSYDKTRRLIIDPVLEYSTVFSGTINGLAIDSNGDVLITGQAVAGLPLQAPYQPSAQNYPVAFVTKFDPTVNQLIYSTYFSGSQSSNAIGLGVDASGNAYITGNSQSPDIPTTAGAFMTQCPGICHTPYVAKFDSAGALVYSTYTGGSDSGVHGIAVDQVGNVFITGSIASPDLPVVSAFEPNFAGQPSTSTRNAFVQKLDPTGSQLVYSTYLGGGGENGTAIALDSLGSAYVVGTSGGGIPLKNALQTDQGTFFLTKFAPQGNALVYSTLLGIGGQYDQPNGIAVDAQGNAFIVGAVTTLQYPFTPNAFQTLCLFEPNPAGGSYCSSPQAIVMEMNSSGTALNYSSLIGDGDAWAIAVDNAGNAYVTGRATSNYFPLINPIEGGQPAGPNFEGGAFLTRLNSSGVPTFSTLLFDMQRGEAALSMAIDSSGAILLAGAGSSADFPVVQPFQSAGGPGFFARLSLSSNTPELSISRLQPWVHIRNVSSVPADISSISVSSPFTLSGTCGTSITLAPASECIAVVTQTVAQIPPPADLTIVSSVLGGPQTFRIQPSQNLPPVPWLYSPSVLRFSPQFIGTTSVPQSVTITNLATQPLTVDSIQASSADFSIMDGCTGTIAPSSSCNFAVAFGPTGGNAVGQITLSYSAPFITGTGNPPSVQDSFFVVGQSSTNSLFTSVQSLTFGGQYPGVAGMPRIVTLFNSTPAPLTLGTPSASGPYSISSACGGVLAAGATCRITVVFVPTGNGFFSGNLQIPFSGAGSPANIALGGIGRLFSDLRISPLSIDFGPATFGGLGNASQLTLTNVSTSSMTISGFSFSDPEFSQTSNCPVSPSRLSASASCLVNLLFKPTSIGTVSATLDIQHTGAGNPQVLSLSGSGRTALDLQPSPLDFGIQAVGSSSQLWFSMANVTAAPIIIQSITVAGSDFQLGPNPCPTGGQQLSSFSACGMPVTFTPSTQGTTTGTLTVVASDFSAPHVVTLSGIGGTAAGANLSASSLYFGFQNVGGKSSAQVLTLSSTGNVPLNISSVTSPAAFSVTNGCPSVLAPGANCSISVAFAPTAPAFQSGTLTILDDATNSPQAVTLSGNGTDFAPQISSGSSSVSVKAGQTATYHLQLAPAGGFTGIVTLACTGAPAKSSCSVAPNNLIVSGNPAAFSVNVVTTASSASTLANLRLDLFMFGFLFACSVWGKRSMRGYASTRLLSAGVFAFLLLLCSCGGGTSGGGTQPPPPVQGTPPGTYSLTVTATSGTQTRSLLLSLTVN